MTLAELADAVMEIRTELDTTAACLDGALQAVRAMTARLERIEVELYEQVNPQEGR